MSKYAVSKRVISIAEREASEENLDRNDVIEALMTTCIQDMKDNRGASYTRDYLAYELDSVGADGVFEIQKR